jgi:hypothetical protein
MKPWTAAQIKKLDVIIWKLEALQREVDDPAADIAHAKSRLMDVFALANRQRDQRKLPIK